jgi:hypothetical protein
MLSPSEGGSCGSETENGTTFEEAITERQLTTPKSLLDSSPGESCSVVRRQRIVDYQCQSQIRLFW